MKKLIIDDEKLMQEWAFDENEKIGLYPNKLTLSNAVLKPFWKCKNCGNIWQATTYKRSIGRGCPICSKKKSWETRCKKIIQQQGCLFTKFPELLEDWDYEKNLQLNPYNITSGSNKKIWWKCHVCGYEWLATANDRSKGKGCYNCNMKKGSIKQKQTKLLKTKPLAKVYPELLKDWDFEHNKADPYDICPSAHYNAYWICHKCNHQWKQFIYARIKGSGCPKCSKVKKYSLSEKIIYYFIRQQFDNSIENYKPKFLMHKELDIFIPDINIAIEYDGERFHKNIQEDFAKNLICQQNNIRLIRIREPKCPKLNFGENYIMQSTKDYLGAINYIFNVLNVNKKINEKDIDNSIKNVYSLINKNILENSVGKKYPELLKEWDYNCNGNIDPFCISSSSNIKINWLCNKGHHFTLPISNRTKRKYGCPYCSGARVIIGLNDLKTKRPDLIPFWDTEKNINLDMTMFREHSSKKVYWKCPICNKKWELRIESMCKRKILCNHQ